MRSKTSLAALTVLVLGIASIYAWGVYHAIQRISLLNRPGIVVIHSVQESSFPGKYFPHLWSIIGPISEIYVPVSQLDNFDDFWREFPEATLGITGTVSKGKQVGGFYVCRVPYRPEDTDGASDD
jgi:hypothetical protein